MIGLRRWWQVRKPSHPSARESADLPRPVAFRGVLAGGAVLPRDLRARALRYVLLTLSGLPFAALGTAVCGQQPAERGQPAAPAPVPGELTGELIKQRRAAAAASDLDEVGKKQVDELYQQAEDSLKRAEEAAQAAIGFKRDTDTAKPRAEKLQQEVERLRRLAPDPRAYEQMDAANLQQEAAKADVRVAELKEQLQAAENTLTEWSAERQKLRTAIGEKPAQIEELERQLEAPAPANEPPAISLARKTQQQARLAQLQSELPKLNNEQAKREAEEAWKLPQLERDRLSELLRTEELRREQIDRALKLRRDESAAAAARQAQAEALRAEPILKPWAEKNAALAEESREVVGKLASVQSSLKQSEQQLEELRWQFKQTRLMVDNVGLTAAVGMLLRKQLATLPSVQLKRVQVVMRQEAIDDAQFALFTYRSERARLSDREEFVTEALAEHRPSLDPWRIDSLSESFREIWERKAEHLDALIRNYDAHFEALIQLDTTDQELIQQVREYRNYIRGRVLWIRSNKTLLVSPQLEQADLVFANQNAWRELGDKMLADLQSAPALYALCGVLAVGWLLQLRRFRRTIREIGAQVNARAYVDFLPTLRVASHTLWLTLFWPSLLLFAGWRLAMGAGENPIGLALSTGLISVAVTLIPLRWMRQVCRRDGLAEAHFAWPDNTVIVLRRSLWWLGVTLLPAVLIVMSLWAIDPVFGNDTLERLAFIAAAIAFSVIASWTLSPTQGVARDYLAFHPDGWLQRLRYVWYYGAIIAPLVLGVLALAGYYYTALQLALRTYLTFALFTFLLAIRDLIARWILVRRRRLAMEQARQRAREQPEAAIDLGVQRDEPTIDLTTQTHQTRRLVTAVLLATGFVFIWVIWVEILPAFSMLENWPLWWVEKTITRMTPNADGVLEPAAENVVHAVTAADLVLAVVVVTLTLAGFRNLPGLLEMSLLQRLPLDSSVRYAITRLASYAIVLIGIVSTFNILGLKWSQIQWLATALTFGLAFGLQEVFANFVAGLIILFERPIRVGDVVTVDGVTGIVSRVRIRATTITNWERKEYVVPNKDFITGRVLNWTLSDKVNRITLQIGVAYGTDVERACQLLREVAENNEFLLDSPPPTVTFEGFGDSALNLTLRAFLPTLENRLTVVHQLHAAVDTTFREAGIEIPFPQRDLHLRNGFNSGGGKLPEAPLEEAADKVRDRSAMPESRSEATS